MLNSIRPVWAEVDLDKLAHNMREIRRVSKSKQIMAVVKADGYGHGALDVAPLLLENGADKLAVAVLHEAIELRKSGIDCPVMILGYTPNNQIQDVVKYNLETAVVAYDYAEKLSEAAGKSGKILKIHIKIDTGMGRIGYPPDESSIDEICRISKLPNLKIEGLFSHFSSADEKDKSYSKSQVEKFNWVYERLTERNVQVNLRHMGNSATIIDLPEYHFDMVRAGIILYGYYPSKEVDKKKIDLRPAMNLKAKIIFIKKMHEGEYVGYGRKYKCDCERVIATLSVGYADGYPRALGNNANVIVKGKTAPVVGKICMDQCMIDVTDIADVKIGDEVILIGEEGNNKLNADYIADILNTISYEVICFIGKRIPRVYVKDNKIVKVRHYV